MSLNMVRAGQCSSSSARVGNHCETLITETLNIKTKMIQSSAYRRLAELDLRLNVHGRHTYPSWRFKGEAKQEYIKSCLYLLI